MFFEVFAWKRYSAMAGFAKSLWTRVLDADTGALLVNPDLEQSSALSDPAQLMAALYVGSLGRPAYATCCCRGKLACQRPRFHRSNWCVPNRTHNHNHALPRA